MDRPITRLLCTSCQRLAQDQEAVLQDKKHLDLLWSVVSVTRHECPLCAELYTWAIPTRNRDGSEPDPLEGSDVLQFCRDFYGIAGVDQVQRWSVWVRRHADGSATSKNKANRNFYRVEDISVRRFEKRGARMWERTTLSLTERIPGILKLFKECREHHPECGGRPHYVPTRLILICGTDAERFNLRLVDRGEVGLDASYSTLSYRWGEGQHRPYRTMKDNISKHRTSIPWELLTPLVQDALQVAHRLHMQYIWIDSLCIVQDDLLDWRREATEMGNIFTHSELTIMAANAESSSEHLAVSVPGPSIIDHEHGIGIRKPSADLRFVEKTSLYSRGWVFQEIMLSRRRLNFCDSQVYWHCRRLLASEDDALLITGYTSHPALTEFDETLKWHDLVNTYTDTNFTYLSDRPRALAGPVKMMQAELGKTPILGLWLETLSTDLAWGCNLKTRTAPLHNCPSWSWLSVDGLVWWGVEEYRPLLEIIACDVFWDGETLVSPLAGARLEVSGRSKEVDLAWIPASENGHVDIVIIEDTDYSEVMLDDVASHFAEVHLTSYLTCRILLAGQYEEDMAKIRPEDPDAGWECEIQFLVLESAPRRPEINGYKRIGVGHMNLPYDSMKSEPVWPKELLIFETVTINLV